MLLWQGGLGNAWLGMGQMVLVWVGMWRGIYERTYERLVLKASNVMLMG